MKCFRWKKNVAIHEFINIMDKEDGKVESALSDIMNEMYTVPWMYHIHQKMSEIDEGKSGIGNVVQLIKFSFYLW